MSPEPGSQGGGSGLRTVYGAPSVLVSAANGQHVTGLPVQCVGAALLHQACFSDSFCSAALSWPLFVCLWPPPPNVVYRQSQAPFPDLAPTLFPPHRLRGVVGTAQWTRGLSHCQVTCGPYATQLQTSIPRPLELSQSFSNCSKIFGSPPVNKWPRCPTHPDASPAPLLTLVSDLPKRPSETPGITHTCALRGARAESWAGRAPSLVEDEGSLPSAWGSRLNSGSTAGQPRCLKKNTGISLCSPTSEPGQETPGPSSLGKLSRDPETGRPGLAPPHP